MNFLSKFFLVIFSAFLSNLHTMNTHDDYSSLCSSMLGGSEFGSAFQGLDLITQEYFEALLQDTKVNYFIEVYKGIRQGIKRSDNSCFEFERLSNLLNLIDDRVFYGTSQDLDALFNSLDRGDYFRKFVQKLFHCVGDQELKKALLVLIRHLFLDKINGEFILFEGLIEILKRYEHNYSHDELVARLQLLTFHNSDAYDELKSELCNLGEDSNHMANSVIPKIRALFQSNSNLNRLCSSFGEGPLHLLATINDKNLISDYLEMHPEADVNQQTFTGLTPLMCATRTLNLEAVTALANADCTIKDNDGKTAYKWLAYQIAQNRFQGEDLATALLIKEKLKNMYTYYQWYFR